VTRLLDRLPAVVATGMGLAVVAGLHAWIDGARSAAQVVLVPVEPAGWSDDGVIRLRFVRSEMQSTDQWVVVWLDGGVVATAVNIPAPPAELGRESAAIFRPGRLDPLVGPADARCCAYARLRVAPSGTAWLDGFADAEHEPLDP
jgi:hypothetical protein